jgi:small-conductance mechanosensitive channel
MLPPRLPPIRMLFCLCLCLLSAFFVGCSSPQEVAALRAQRVAEAQSLTDKAAAADASAAPLNAALSDLMARNAALTQQVQALQAGSAARLAAEASATAVARQLSEVQKSLDALKATSTAARERAQALTAQVAKSDSLVAEASSPTNAGTTIGTVASTFWPPAALFAPLLGGLLWKNVKLGQAKGALTDKVSKLAAGSTAIVRSIDVLSRVAPEVATAIKSHAKTLDLIQGPLGKALVDAAQTVFTLPPAPLPDHPDEAVLAAA